MRAPRIFAVWCFLFALLLATVAASAQDEPSRPDQNSDEQQAKTEQQQQNQQNQDNQPSPAASETASPAPDLSFERPTVNLATGQVLSKTRSPFHWGNFSVMSLSFLQVYDSNYLFLKDNQKSAQAGAVQGLLVYSLKSSRSDFNLQYRPQFWASDEFQQFDYSSHMVDFHTFRYLAQDWGININDQFQYAPDRGRLEQVGFSPDYSAGLSTQNPFMATGRRLVSNAADISLDHRLGAHDRIDFTGRHQYIHVSNDPTAAATDPFSSATQQQDFGGQFGWTHTWRRDNEFGVQYSYDREFFEGFDSDAQLHGVLVGFSRRLFPSLLLRAGAGPALLMPAKPKGAIQPLDNQITFQANAALYKSFRHSGMTLSYSRNNNFTGAISDGLNDRFDVSYSQRFFRRVDVVIGGAYLRQDYSIGPHLYGKSGWSEIDYRLSRAWSLYGSYTYMTQTGGPVLFGPRQLVTSGIRWTWDFERGQSFGRQ